MQQPAAPMSPAIKMVTGVVLLMTAGCLAAALFAPLFFLLGLVVGAVALCCYLFAPVAYELYGGRLTVHFRLGQKVFGPVVRCAPVAARPPWGLRLWGNGGLFACTGIFWNKSYGVFRAYLTSARCQDQVLVETGRRKILISPQNPEEFVRSCANSVAS